MPGTANDILKREIQILTFDQYGTIVDMQTDLAEAVTPFLRDKGWDGAPHRFVTWWRRTHFENSMIDSLCDRGSHALPGDRAPGGFLRHGPAQHHLQPGRGAVAHFA